MSELRPHGPIVVLAGGDGDGGKRASPDAVPAAILDAAVWPDVPPVPGVPPIGLLAPVAASADAGGAAPAAGGEPAPRRGRPRGA